MCEVNFPHGVLSVQSLLTVSSGRVGLNVVVSEEGAAKDILDLSVAISRCESCLNSWHAEPWILETT